jgi:branched-subunit amino acid transport protein
MITQQEILLIIGMMLVTFAARYPLMVLVGKIELPEQVIRALRYVPVAVLTAIIVPAALMPQPAGRIDLSLNNAYLYAALATMVIAWRTKNLLATITGGMLIFFLWRMITFALQ